MVCNKFLVNSIKTLIYSIVLAVTPQPGEGPKPFPSLTTATTSTASVSGGGGGVASTMSTSTTTATTTLSSPFSLSSILQDKTESIQDLRWVAIGYNSQQYNIFLKIILLLKLYQDESQKTPRSPWTLRRQRLKQFVCVLYTTPISILEDNLYLVHSLILEVWKFNKTILQKYLSLLFEN